MNAAVTPRFSMITLVLLAASLHATLPASVQGPLALLLAAQPAAAQTIRYVDAGAPETGDGTSWSAAYRYLHNAVAEANEGSGSYEIRVAAGVYYPDDENPDLSDPSFRIDRDGIQLLGGYPKDSHQSGGGTRDPEAHLTVLSGDLDQDDVDPDGDGIVESPDDIQGTNAAHIVRLDRLFQPDPFTAATVVDGFVLTAGFGGSDNRGGAGLLLQQGGDDFDDAPVLRNLTFVGNAAFAGAGLSAVTWSSDRGKGRAAPDISDVTFRNNTVYSDLEQYNGPGSGGAAAFIGRIDASVTRATFENNAAVEQGGAVYAAPETSGDTVSVVLRDVMFRGNHAEEGGGAVFFSERFGGAQNTLLIDRAVFEGNGTGSLQGGLGGLGGSGTITIANATFAGNAGGIRFDASGADDQLRLVNVTLVDNTALVEGALNLYLSGNAEIYNVVLWNSDDSAQQLAAFEGDLAIRNSVVRNGCDAQTVFLPATIDCGDGSTIYEADPLLTRMPAPGADGFGDDPDTPGVDESADDDYGNLRLVAGSPLIEMGTNAALDLDGDGRHDLASDIGGGARLYGGFVDIGAYEYATPVAVTTSPEVGSQTGFFDLGEAGALVYFSENASTSGILNAERVAERPGGAGLPDEVAPFVVSLDAALGGDFSYNLTLDVSDLSAVEAFSALAVYVTEDSDLTSATWTALSEEDIARDSLGQRITAVGQTRFAAFTVGGPEGSFTVDIDHVAAPAAAPALQAPFPNPAHKGVTIGYELHRATFVQLEVYDVQGRRVQVLKSGFSAAGRHHATFEGEGLAAGVYFCRMQAGRFSAAVPFTLIR